MPPKQYGGLLLPLLPVCLILLLITATVSQVLDRPRGPWRLVFKVVRGKKVDGTTGFADLYAKSNPYNNESVVAQTDFSSTSEPFSSHLLAAWGKGRLNVQAVKLSFFKNNIEKKYIVFNGIKKTKDDWFSCNNILYSSYTDLPDPDLPENCPGSSDTFPWSVQKIGSSQARCTDTRGWTVVADSTLTFAHCETFQPYDGVDLPYFKYASGSVIANLSNELELEDADSIGVFLQVWDMVFKGVSGLALTGPKTTLADLWASDVSLNEQAISQKVLTKSISSVQYKSSVVNAWEQYHIDMVKFSMLKAGEDVSYVVFNGIGTNKIDWFSNNNILQSSYSDTTATKQVCSIQGDEYRDWQIQERADNSGCTESEQLGWLLVREYSEDAGLCSWDNYVTLGHPYFLYSQAETADLPGSNNFDHADLMAVFVHGWHLVVKVAAGGTLGSASSVFDLWVNTYTLNEGAEGATSLLAETVSYKSSLIDQWNNYYIRAVKVALYSGGEEVKSIVFDATAATKTSWFDCKRILYSSLDSVGQAGHTSCSIDGDISTSRRFFVGTPESCLTATGVMAVLDTNQPQSECQRSGTLPRFAYSGTTTGSLSIDDDQSEALTADVFAIFLDMDPRCSDVCMNNAPCEELAGTFKCFCVDDFYGDTCSDFDGSYSEWVLTSPCSVSCDGGVEKFTRYCDNPPSQGNGMCHGDSERVEVCNTQPCPIDGGFSTWTQWTDCTKTCATGSRTRSRECNNPLPEHGGADCDGDLSETEDCNTQNCPIDGNWSAWSDWSTCPVTCNGGVHSRNRACNNPEPQYGGAECTGGTLETTSCNTDTCPPVDGGFSEWTQWTECTKTCSTGSHTRSRECNNPVPEHGGADCDGDPSETADCNTQNCPIHGQWSVWSNWTSCTASCGLTTGIQNRSRTCTNPAPQWQGDPCDGDSEETQYCNNFICPIHGGWGNWSDWTTCNVTCGIGYQSRSRSCDNPSPLYGGDDCQGNSTEIEQCNSPCLNIQCDPNSPSECTMHFRNSGVSLGYQHMRFFRVPLVTISLFFSGQLPILSIVD